MNKDNDRLQAVAVLLGRHSVDIDRMQTLARDAFRMTGQLAADGPQGADDHVVVVGRDLVAQIDIAADPGDGGTIASVDVDPSTHQPIILVSVTLRRYRRMTQAETASPLTVLTETILMIAQETGADFIRMPGKSGFMTLQELETVEERYKSPAPLTPETARNHTAVLPTRPVVARAPQPEGAAASLPPAEESEALPPATSIPGLKEMLIEDANCNGFPRISETEERLDMVYSATKTRMPNLTHNLSDMSLRGTPLGNLSDDDIALHYALRGTPDLSELDDDERPSLPTRLATWTMNGIVALISPPVAAALFICNIGKGEDFRLTAHGMTLTGLFLTLNNAEMGLSSLPIMWP